MFWPFIYRTTVFWGPENANFWKGGLKWKFKRNYTVIVYVYKVQKHEFVKMEMYHVFSL